MPFPDKTHVDFDDEHAAREGRRRRRPSPDVHRIAARRTRARTALVAGGVEIVGDVRAAWRRSPPTAARVSAPSSARPSASWPRALSPPLRSARRHPRTARARRARRPEGLSRRWFQRARTRAACIGIVQRALHARTVVFRADIEEVRNGCRRNCDRCGSRTWRIFRVERTALSNPAGRNARLARFFLQVGRGLGLLLDVLLHALQLAAWLAGGAPAAGRAGRDRPCSRTPRSGRSPGFAAHPATVCCAKATAECVVARSFQYACVLVGSTGFSSPGFAADSPGFAAVLAAGAGCDGCGARRRRAAEVVVRVDLGSRPLSSCGAPLRPSPRRRATAQTRRPEARAPQESRPNNDEIS